MREFPKPRSTAGAAGKTESSASFSESGAGRDIYTVSRLNKAARQILETAFPQVWVEGEISNLSAPGSGHLYFSLKDGTAQIRGAYFRNRRAIHDYQPADGDQVLIRARMTVYEPRGDYQLVVQYMEPAGEGALRLRFEKLKQALAARGLFDSDQKRDLPTLPRRIGVITSPTGAAVRDIIATCKRRFSAIPLVIYPTAVQGEQALEGILQAIATAQRRAECDVLILARGGGSLEDLWVFNEEALANEIYNCSIPVITGVGHQTDYTIADFVADHRAATPTAAAEIVVPEADRLRLHVRGLVANLDTRMRRILEQAMQRNDLYAHRLIHPTRRFNLARQRCQPLYSRLIAQVRKTLYQRNLQLHGRAKDLMQHSPGLKVQQSGWRMVNARQRMNSHAQAMLTPRRQHLSAIAARLDTVSPLATLDRGYALVIDENKNVVNRASQVQPGSKVDVKLAAGELSCRVEKVHK